LSLRSLPPSSIRLSSSSGGDWWGGGEIGREGGEGDAESDTFLSF